MHECIFRISVGCGETLHASLFLVRRSRPPEIASTSQHFLDSSDIFFVESSPLKIWQLDAV